MTAMQSGRRVVVGVSDSAAGQAAIRKAVGQAVTRGCDLHLVRVWRELDWLPSMTRADARALPTWERDDKKILADAADLANSLDPVLGLIVEWAPGDLYAAMTRAADGADLVVVGRSSDGAIEFGHWLAENVACPVELVAATDDSDVVVGAAKVSRAPSLGREPAELARPRSTVGLDGTSNKVAGLSIS